MVLQDTVLGRRIGVTTDKEVAVGQTLYSEYKY